MWVAQDRRLEEWGCRRQGWGKEGLRARVGVQESGQEVGGA